MTRARKVLFASLAVCLATVFALVAAEFLLSWQRARIEQSDAMDPGLIAYDRILGWRLVPGWRGRHRHHDFDVAYTVGPHGFRGPPPAAHGAGRRIALVGDSFTFGLGVGDEDTIARRLAGELPEGDEVLNFGVPGYSTDQEVLLVERAVLPLHPDVVILLVCLINDVFDNPRPFPLQASHAKPRFALRGGELVLERVPVPRERKPLGAGRVDLQMLVRGPDARDPSGIAGFLGRREVFRRLGIFQADGRVSADAFLRRNDDALALFDALLGRMEKDLVGAGAHFVVALVPGRSYVERPGSYAHGYQEVLRARILETCRARGLRVVDVASALAKRHAEGSGPWYHPHEGHLDREGSAEVARLLDHALREGS